MMLVAGFWILVEIQHSINFIINNRVACPLVPLPLEVLS